jgi:hypothetical protein
MQAQALYMSIDVECVATGLRHNDRAVAQIALVDQARPCRAPAVRVPLLTPRPPTQFEQPLLNLYVRPEEAVVSYLTPLTGAF